MRLGLVILWVNHPSLQGVWAKDLKFKPSSLTELSLQKPDNILQTESSKILKELKR